MEILFLENLNYGHFEVRPQRPEFNFHEVKQVHGTDIATLKELPCEADGLVVPWNEMTTPLAIRTADCLPIVIEGESGAVFLHAGWRGLAAGILKRPQIKSIGPQRALIGPSIHNCCFEVSKDFQGHFPDSPNFVRREGKLYFNLQQEAKDQLRESYPRLLIEIVPICTVCNSKFHSHRRNQTTERNWNIYIKG